MALPIELGLILLFSIAGGILAVRLKQPSVLGLLIVGSIVGPYSLGIIHDTALINTAIEIGAILLLFTIGIEFSLENLFNYGLRALSTAAIKLGLVFVAGYLISSLMGFGVITSLYIGVILSITSTVIFVKILEQKGMSSREELSLLVTILILEDLFGVFALTFFSSLNAKTEFAPLNLFTEFIISLTIMAVFFVVLKKILRPAINWLVKYSTEDTITFMSIGLCAGMSYLAYLLHLSPSVGAFLAGSIVSSLPDSKMFQKAIHPFILTFTALFFFSIGTIVNFSVVFKSLIVIFILLAANIIIKFTSIGFGSYIFNNFTGKQAVFSGIAMLSVGEFSLLIAKEAETAGLGIELVDITAALIVFSTIGMAALIGYSDIIYRALLKYFPASAHRDLDSAKKYFSSLSLIVHSDKMGLRRATLEWKSLRNNAVGLFFIIASSYLAFGFFRQSALGFTQSRLIVYLITVFLIAAVLFPSINIVRRASCLFTSFSNFCIKIYPIDIANEKKVLRNLVILGVGFVFFLALPEIILFLGLNPIYYISFAVLAAILAVYLFKTSKLIRSIVSGNSPVISKLRNKDNIRLSGSNDKK